MMLRRSVLLGTLLLILVAANRREQERGIYFICKYKETVRNHGFLHRKQLIIRW